jgi:hypothetical protein
MKITIYTDGSSRGNPGPGGWGAILLVESGKSKSKSHNADADTNTDATLDEVIELGGGGGEGCSDQELWEMLDSNLSGT